MGENHVEEEEAEEGSTGHSTVPQGVSELEC